MGVGSGVSVSQDVSVGRIAIVVEVDTSATLVGVGRVAHATNPTVHMTTANEKIKDLMILISRVYNTCPSLFQNNKDLAGFHQFIWSTCSAKFAHEERVRIIVKKPARSSNQQSEITNQKS